MSKKNTKVAVATTTSVVTEPAAEPTPVVEPTKVEPATQVVEQAAPVAKKSGKPEPIIAIGVMCPTCQSAMKVHKGKAQTYLQCVNGKCRHHLNLDGTEFTPRRKQSRRPQTAVAQLPVPVPAVAVNAADEAAIAAALTAALQEPAAEDSLQEELAAIANLNLSIG